MPSILNIDSATQVASVCLTDNEAIVALEQSTEQKEHAAFLQPAIKRIFEKTERSLSDVDAIAVTAGPGSYTGLRVGLATAKGLCYAIKKPLILLNTLEVMAYASVRDAQQTLATNDVLFCPMIDARRMEVFTAIYTDQLAALFPPAAVILDRDSFRAYLDENQVIFSGNGSTKCAELIKHEHAVFTKITHDASHMSILSLQSFFGQKFADIAYSEPFYLKEFFTPVRGAFDKKF